MPFIARRTGTDVDFVLGLHALPTGPALITGGAVLVWLLLERAVRRKFWLTAFLEVGGTFMHEMSHLLVGLLLQAKPVSLSIWPKQERGQWVLGYVQFSNLNLLNSAFVGLAPLTLFWLGVEGFKYWAVPALAAHALSQWLLACYLIAGCFRSGLPSSTDIRLSAVSTAMYCLVAYSIWKLVGGLIP